MLKNITPIILTYNEEPNIQRTLECLQWAEMVIVVDSGSTDQTVSICSRFENVLILVRPFDTFEGQWSYALAHEALDTEWVLALDADYVLTDGLVNEITALKRDNDIVGYWAHFVYCIHGEPLSGSLYPPIVTLYQRKYAHYIQDGHAHRLVIEGRLETFENKINHDDRKSFGRWLISQDRYAEDECQLLLGKQWSELRWQDRLRKLIFITPIIVPIYCLTIGKGALDGWAGIYYAIQRGIAESVLSVKLVEAKIFGNKK